MAKSKWSYGKSKYPDTEIRSTYYFGKDTTQREISELVDGILQESGLEKYYSEETSPLAINIPATVWNEYLDTSELRKHILTVAIPECPNPYYPKDTNIPQAVLFFRNYEGFERINDEQKQRYATLRDKITRELEEKSRKTREPNLYHENNPRNTH